MIDWVETLRAYKDLLDWPHYNQATLELCYYYQNKCRFYEDEVYCYSDSIWPSRKWNKNYTDYIDLSGK